VVCHIPLSYVFDVAVGWFECHIPSSYGFEIGTDVEVGCVLRAVEVTEGGGTNSAGADQPFSSGITVSMGGIEA